MELIAIKMCGPILILCTDILLGLAYNWDQFDHIAHIEDLEVIKLLTSMESVLYEE